MRALLCGGGTAGHVMPAIAIGEIIEKGFSGSTVAYAGRSGGAENKAYEASGNRLYTVDISGISRSLSANSIKSIFKVLKSGRTALSIINDFKPDIIIGTGGYVCYPFVRQGQRLGIKTIIHESNAYPGLVTRILGKKCDRLMLNLEGTRAYLKGAKNTVVVGNPTRSAFGNIDKVKARRILGIRDNERLIVSFGGSLGAELINRTVAEVICKYTSKDASIRHIHATGKANFDDTKKRFPTLFASAGNALIKPYIDNMPLVLTAADLAITRSGAITLAELCRSGTPSILIPSPNVSANHQYVNAAYLRDRGAALLIEEKDLSPEVLYGEISALLESPERMRIMARRARATCPKETEKAIKDVINDLSN